MNPVPSYKELLGVLILSDITCLIAGVVLGYLVWGPK